VSGSTYPFEQKQLSFLLKLRYDNQVLLINPTTFDKIRIALLKLDNVRIWDWEKGGETTERQSLLCTQICAVFSRVGWHSVSEGVGCRISHVMKRCGECTSAPPQASLVVTAVQRTNSLGCFPPERGGHCPEGKAGSRGDRARIPVGELQYRGVPQLGAVPALELLVPGRPR
jgi:hypothetical protein